MAKKNAKPVAAKKKAKKTAVKKAVKKSARSTRGIPGIPCICIKVRGRWFCMKEEGDALIQCDGPFATKAECEEHRCF